MKNSNTIFIVLFSLLLAFFSCNDGIDPITEVDPGADASAPTVLINFPLEGTTIKVYDVVTSINIDFEVNDDIEIASVSVKIDGNEIANFNDFLDYRIFIKEFTYDNVTTGDHILNITATDIEDKSTSAIVNFVKEPPYTPLFDGETLYMPFDGDFIDLISITNANEVGAPGFAGEGKIGLNSLIPGTDNYLTFPTGDLLTNQFSASFWYKVDGTPDRSGILVVGDDETDRNQGFRLFREGNTTEQRIKLNVGIGTGESWNDGDVIDVTAGEWVHVAFTISDTENTIYLNGQAVSTSAMASPVDWTGCEQFTIGAGGETFSYWDHLSDDSSIDDLRFFNKALTGGEVQAISDSAYEPKFDGETFFMPFNGSLTELNTGAEASAVGTPTYAGISVEGSDSFMGATDSYATFPINGLFGTDTFSATFWYKVNPTPDRAGILVVGDDETDRNQGFRLFREGNGTEQRIKVNVGIGTGESWNDGGVIDVTADAWVHIALTVSPTESKIYLDGIETLTSTFGTPIDWTGCTDLVIGAGGPTFSYWGHLSDISAIDALRIFDKALSQSEIQTIMAD